MKVLRIKLTQSKASYTREETVNNKMTYPLPQYSTIIGALHNACGYTNYHNMDISVQGKYRSMQKEIYVNHTLLNSLMDDRSLLIWMKDSETLSAGYVKVAEALKGEGNSFKNKITIQTYDKEKLEEYIKIKEVSEELRNYELENIRPKEIEWKKIDSQLKNKLKEMSEKSTEALLLKKKIKEEKDKISSLKEEYKKKKIAEVEEKIKHFKTLTKGPQTWEVLYDVELVIHVRSDNETIQDILSNQNNFVSLGRSEDFIELQEMKIVELTKNIEDDYELPNGYSMYVNIDEVDIEQNGDKDYFLSRNGLNKEAKGTIYYVSKNYKIQGKKRIFNKIPCLYSSYICLDYNNENGLLDKDGGYIVNFN